MSAPAVRLSTRTGVAARFFATACLLLGVGELLFSNPWLGLFLLCAAGLIGAGLFAFRWSQPSLGTALVIIGSAWGGLLLVWTIVGTIVAVVVIAFCAIDARRGRQ